jgi:hypothetical protein
MRRADQLELDFSHTVAPVTAQRAFLDWAAPALPSAADWLLDKAPPHDRVLDLQQLVVCLPSARAGRRLLEALVDRAELQRRGLLPPAIVTLGALPELLYVSDERVASDEERLLAWTEAVLSLDVRALLGGETPDAAGARQLAKSLMRLQDELAAARIGFGDVCARAGDTDPLRVARWSLLQAIAGAQQELLSGAGLCDVHVARERALKAGAVRSEKTIVLLACVDLPPLVHAMLSTVRANVVPLVFAPERMRDRFDALGTLQTAPWLNAAINIPDTALSFCSSAREQGAAVRDAIARAGDELAIDEITLAVLDDEVIAPIESELAEEGIAVHLGTPRPFAESAPARLLAATRDLLQGWSTRAFSVWVRHPDVEKKLHMGAALLPTLDALRAEHFAERFAPPFLGSQRQRALLEDLHGRALDLLGPLGHEDEAPLLVWAAETVRFAARVFGSRSLSRDHPSERALLDALETLMAACERLTSEGRLTSRPMRAAEALDWIAFVLQDAQIAPPPALVAIEVIGWLDVLLDDAPALVVTSMNDGFVPEAVNADPFLPNGLRARLGLVDNDRRHARDAYVLSAALHTRPGLHLCVGSRTLVGDPLLPSRLLFACDPETAARRLKALPGTRASSAARPTANAPSKIEVPTPLPLDAPIAQMSVSSFRTYLACPYRFYLRHVEYLRDVDDEAHELDPGAFGTFAHAILRAFGESDDKDATDARVVRAMLEATLCDLTRQTFGNDVPIAIRLQLSQLKERLHHFAVWQARWAEQGWSIRFCERAFDGTSAPFLVDGAPMYLKGKIDRIDEHKDGRVIVFDYKTSDRPKPPDAVHRRKGAWRDLQLPLYRRLWRSTGDDRSPTLAYLNIAPTAHDTGYLAATWSADDLAAADAVASEVIRKVRRAEFWPPTSPPPKFFDAYAAICQDGQLIDEDDEEDEA